MSDTYPWVEPPQAAQQPTQVQPSVVDQWGMALQDPNIRTGLMQFGLQLMQPMGFGQTASGHLGQALGAGGEAVNRAQTQERAEREQASKAELREAQASTAEQRATIAGERAATASREADSKADLRRAQAAGHIARAQYLKTQVENLELKTAMYPQDLALKQELARARTELANAQAAAVTENAATAARRADTQERNVNSQVEDRDRRFGLSETIQQQREREKTLSETRYTRADYDKYKADLEKANANRRLMQQPELPELSFDDWLRRGTPRSGGTGAGASAVPTAPPVIGEERRGYIYLGGDPGSPSSWRKK